MEGNLEVRPSSRLNIEVTGKLTTPIIFTSDAGVPQAGDWYGIELGGLDAEEQVAYGSIGVRGKRRRTDIRLKTNGGRSSEICFAPLDNFLSNGANTTKSPYIPLYKRGRLEKGFPLWKRGTKGDSSLYKRGIGEEFPPLKKGD